MIDAFTFIRPPRIRFGAQTLSEVPGIVTSLGKKAVLVTGASSLKNSGVLQEIGSQFKNASIEYTHVFTTGEPSTEQIDELTTACRAFKPDVVVAVGGGSVIDAGKAIAAMLRHEGGAADYLEDIGTRRPSGEKAAFVAVPTTAGTGSEATTNAVLRAPGKNGAKKSLRHVNFMPDAAVVDPRLMVGCPPEVTAACGMDAFTQLLESYVSVKASALTDALALSGIEQVRDTLLAAASTGASDVGVRSGMAYGALMSGITLANAGLGVVHGMAGVIGGRFQIPHGVVCGSLVGPATKATIEKLRRIDPMHPALCKYAVVGWRLINTSIGSVENGCDNLLGMIAVWSKELHIPSLGDYGITPADIEAIANESGNRNNPAQLDKKEMEALLREAM